MPFLHFSKFHDRFRTLHPDIQGWIVCVTTLLLTVTRSGITYSFGVFVVKLQNTYHTRMATQNWIGTLSFAISLGFAPLTVLIIRSFGRRGYQVAGYTSVIILSISCMASSLVSSESWLFLTHSFFYGAGSSLALMASSLVIGEYFDKSHKRHVLATSILLCGYPLGSLLFNPFNGWLVNQYGWRVAFRVSSILIFIIGMACATTFWSRYTQESTAVDDSFDYEGYRHRMFHSCDIRILGARPEIGLWLIGNMLSFVGFYMPFVNLAYYMHKKEISIPNSAWALTVLSLCECASYIVMAAIGDFLKGKLVYLNLFASVGLSVICFSWPFLDINYSAIIAIAAALGGFLGLTIVYQYAASGEVTKLPIDVAWSSTNMFCGIGILLGPLFSGVIYDIRRNYDDVFFVCGGIYVTQILVFGGIVFLRRRRGGECSVEYDDLDEPNGKTKSYVAPNLTPIHDVDSIPAANGVNQEDYTYNITTETQLMQPNQCTLKSDMAINSS